MLSVPSGQNKNNHIPLLLSASCGPPIHHPIPSSLQPTCGGSAIVILVSKMKNGFGVEACPVKVTRLEMVGPSLDLSPSNSGAHDFTPTLQYFSSSYSLLLRNISYSSRTKSSQGNPRSIKLGFYQTDSVTAWGFFNKQTYCQKILGTQIMYYTPAS